MLFNPFTGTPRHPNDIRSDPDGFLLWDGEARLRAAQAAQPAQMPAWLPIESAPKDGTVIALANSKITHSGRWSNSRYSGKWWMAGDFVAAFSMIVPPTHWQHLPAAPVADTSQNEKSKTCQHCKHWELRKLNSAGDTESQCKSIDVFDLIDLWGRGEFGATFRPPTDFGCNRWEEKS